MQVRSWNYPIKNNVYEAVFYAKHTREMQEALNNFYRDHEGCEVISKIIKLDVDNMNKPVFAVFITYKEMRE